MRIQKGSLLLQHGSWHVRFYQDGKRKSLRVAPEGSDQKKVRQLGMLKAKRDTEKKYGKKFLMEDVKDDWSWAFLSGKVSAIRWVLGLDWDMLDS